MPLLHCFSSESKNMVGMTLSTTCVTSFFSFMPKVAFQSWAITSQLGLAGFVQKSFTLMGKHYLLSSVSIPPSGSWWWLFCCSGRFLCCFSFPVGLCELNLRYPLSCLQPFCSPVRMASAGISLLTSFKLSDVLCFSTWERAMYNAFSVETFCSFNEPGSSQGSLRSLSTWFMTLVKKNVS